MSGPRRPTGPRTPTSRPRRVAGRRLDGDPQPVDELTEQPGVVPAVEPAHEPVAEPAPEPVERPREIAEGEIQAATPRSTSRRTTVLLAAATLLLLVVAAVEVWYVRGGADDEGAGGDASRGVSAANPVVLSDLTVRSVIDQAATDATTILSASWRTYDAQVRKATATMTDDFAAKYVQTKKDVRTRFVAQQATVSVDISNQGVVSASPDEVRVLLFLTQTTIRKQSPVTPAQYRVTVTMRHQGDTWLVSDLEAR